VFAAPDPITKLVEIDVPSQPQPKSDAISVEETIKPWGILASYPISLGWRTYATIPPWYDDPIAGATIGSPNLPFKLL
jgi:hypothetical protein